MAQRVLKQSSKTQELVFIGGGHSHAIALRQLSMRPIPGARLSLLSAGTDTPYSGMLPGYVAGHYTYEDCHIDLGPLAQAAQARFIVDRAIRLDLESQHVICAQHSPIPFDVLSIDIGSTPELPPLLRKEATIVPVKPWSQFLAQWQHLIDVVKRNPAQPLSLAIIGGGAGGVELALTIQYQLQHIVRQAVIADFPISLHLFHRGSQVMTGHNRWVQRRFRQILQRRRIQLHLLETVTSVDDGILSCESGFQLACDLLFWVTRASAPEWPRISGLATDPSGFIQVGPTLQSCSHPQVFATGDIAAMVKTPRPKAGVFAVRQGKPLTENLRRFLAQRPLKPFSPQRQILGLISTGDRNAVMSWGPLPLGWESPILWKWKDHIDRKFMAQFYDLAGKA